MAEIFSHEEWVREGTISFSLETNDATGKIVAILISKSQPIEGKVLLDLSLGNNRGTILLDTSAPAVRERYQLPPQNQPPIGTVLWTSSCWVSNAHPHVNTLRAPTWVTGRA